MKHYDIYLGYDGWYYAITGTISGPYETELDATKACLEEAAYRLAEEKEREN